MKDEHAVEAALTEQCMTKVLPCAVQALPREGFTVEFQNEGPSVAVRSWMATVQSMDSVTSNLHVRERNSSEHCPEHSSEGEGTIKHLQSG